jgi:hypothetical protein
MEVSLKGEIDLIALYAAVVATGVLLWDVVKWWRSGPRLKGKVSTNMATINMGPMDNDTHVIIDLSNIGDRATTLKGLYITGYESRCARLRGKARYNAFIRSGLEDSYPVPGSLGLGANFKASFMQTPDIEESSRKLLLYVQVVHSAGTLELRIPPIAKTNRRIPGPQK